MRIRSIVWSLLLVMAVFAYCPGAARAQDTSSYDDIEIDINQDVVWMNIGVSLLRDPAMPPENFILNLSTTDRYTTGCPPLKDMAFETEYEKDALIIRVEKLVVDQSKFPYYDCNNKPRNPKAEAVLNKKELMDKGIKKIIVAKGKIEKVYQADITEEKIELGVATECANKEDAEKKKLTEKDCAAAKISSIRIQNVNGVKNPLHLWFYPEGTLLLYTPGTDGDRTQIREKIHGLAVGMGLTPLEEIYPSFKTPLVRDDYAYFVDKTGRHKDMAVDGTGFGNISVEKMAYGLEGDVPTLEKLPVFARRPGAYD